MVPLSYPFSAEKHFLLHFVRALLLFSGQIAIIRAKGQTAAVSGGVSKGPCDCSRFPIEKRAAPGGAAGR